jgi:hypothetical protein
LKLSTTSTSTSIIIIITPTGTAQTRRIMLATQIRILLCISTQFLLTTAFVVSPNHHHGTTLSTRLYSAEVQHEGESRRRLPEFLNLEPLPQSDARRERLYREEQNSINFAQYGNELWKLRAHIQDLSVELIDAMNKGKDAVEYGVRQALRKVEQQDPELVYKMELEAMRDAEETEDIADEIHHKELALNARTCLPHFNLEGLWVGK